MSGLLIALEGSDGCGKSTQIKLLEDRLRSENHKVLITREPGGTRISEKIRAILLDTENTEMSDTCEALLYAASRAQLIDEVIKPALASGEIIICDRFVHSSLVYQGIARNLGVENIQGLNNFALNGLVPDLTIMIDIDYEVGMDRKAKQKELDRLELSGNDFHKKVYDGYKMVRDTMDNIVTVDGTKSLEEVHEDIYSIVMREFGKKR